MSAFPARFQLIAAMNPCKCGMAGTPGHTCKRGDRCASDYQARVSGPFLDRIDLRIDVPAVSAADMIGPSTAETSANVAARVQVARERQRQRYAEAGQPDIFTNAAAGPTLIEKLVDPDKESQTLLLQAAERFNLSARAYHRVLKVARTLADLAGVDKVARPHVAEALSYRINFALGWSSALRGDELGELAILVAGGVAADLLEPQQQLLRLFSGRPIST